MEEARALFTEKGVDGASLAEIARRAGVSKGALYHHFRDKVDLYDAVYGAIQADLLERMGAAMIDATTPFEAVQAGAVAYFDFCLEPDARVAIIEGPRVLGWQRYRLGDPGHHLLGSTLALQACIDDGTFAPQPSTALFAHLVVGAADEGSLVIAHAEDPEDARRQVGAAFEAFLAALRVDGGIDG